jgi:hypothetical protein
MLEKKIEYVGRPRVEGKHCKLVNDEGNQDDPNCKRRIIKSEEICPKGDNFEGHKIY